ncbi:MAG: carboxynorspermidine decarboxylase, partial [Lentisphaerae bacterium]
MTGPFDWIETCPSPAYVVEEEKLLKNAQVLRDVARASGARVLLALKAFAMHPVLPLIRDFTDGVCASGAWEARLGYEFIGKDVHSYNPGFSQERLAETLKYSRHVSLNSLNQWRRFENLRQAYAQQVSFGLRINPECSASPVALYDPCAAGSRLGIRREELNDGLPAGVEGLHMHVLCEQDFSALEKVCAALETRFGEFLTQVKWLNLGGGHHIT